jgi:hypothetical protein
MDGGVVVCVDVESRVGWTVAGLEDAVGSVSWEVTGFGACAVGIGRWRLNWRGRNVCRCRWKRESRCRRGLIGSGEFGCEFGCFPLLSASLAGVSGGLGVRQGG